MTTTVHRIASTDPVLVQLIESSRVPAGFPSPAADFDVRPIELRDLLTDHPEATFFLRVSGRSMEGAGIFDGDVVVVDRSLDAQHGDVVVAILDGELTVKRLHQRDGVLRLEAHGSEGPSFEPQEGSEWRLWGVVVTSLRPHRAGRLRSL
ncbi:LexA family protein [Amphibiibacter pelophylacis]|uniref:Translesion error-prone DNA polymerase V autoproteolytic subunit n=1 Tax=Amphibiibacter pelophylacis TaxID=1799477 RepID=A0ACC6P1B9_9BURK